MNIKFKSIDIQNFRSIDRMKVSLSNQGTVIVKGMNEYEEKATSNGSGKSSIFEAIIYALFEETSSGEKDVENRIINDGYGICLELDIDNSSYTINRQGKNGKSSVALYKNNEDISARNKTDTNKLIQNLLGINKNIFLDSVFLSQNAVTNLASLAPANRKERLEILTNTDSAVNTFKEAIKQQQAEYESKCITHQQNISELSGKLSATNNQIATLQNKINEINAEIERKAGLGTIEQIQATIDSKQAIISSNNSQIQEYNNQIESLKIEYDKSQLESSKIQESKKPLLEDKESVQSNKSDSMSQLTKIKSEIANYNININRIEKEIVEIKNSESCPTCGRKYDNANEQHIAETIAKKQKDIAEQANLIKEAEYNITTIEDEIYEYDNKIKNINEQIDKIDLDVSNSKANETKLFNNIDELLNKINYIHSTNTNIDNEIKILQNNKEEILKIESNSIKEYENMINNLSQDVINISNSIQSEKNEYEETNSHIGAIKHILQLVTKEFRTYLLQNSLQYLNKLLLAYSNKLFSNEKDIIKISEGDSKLDIQLGDATYESLSGGEKTRVNIALLLAQKSLASMIGNISCNIIILDEILGYCDSSAEANVINLISAELESLESIYMVSHKELPIGYDSELIVVKDKKGLSRLRTY